MPDTGGPANILTFDGSETVQLDTLLNLLANSVNSAFGAHGAVGVADLAALATVSATTVGTLRKVTEGGALFVSNGTKFVQITPAVFGSTSTRDTAYAKASAAYRTDGAQVYRTDTGRTEQYFGTYNSSTNPKGAAVAGWYPISGKPLVGRLTTATAQATSGTANTYVPMLWSTDVEASGMFNIGNPDRFTITQAGLYLCTGRLRGFTADFFATFGVGGTLVDKTTAGATNIGIVGLHSILYLPAGSFVNINYARVSAGAQSVIVGQCEFEIQYIGPGSVAAN